MEEKICPICKGEKFIKTRRVNISGFEYVFYKECECLNPKKPKVQHDNPFEKEEEKNNGNAS